MSTIKQEIAARTEAEKKAFESKVETLSFVGGAFLIGTLFLCLFMEVDTRILCAAFGIAFGIGGSLQYLGLLPRGTSRSEY